MRSEHDHGVPGQKYGIHRTFRKLLALAWLLPVAVHAQAAKLLEIENSVKSAAGAEGAWVPATKGQSLAIGDGIQTERRSRALLQLTDLYNMRLAPRTTIRIAPVMVDGSKPKLDLNAGGVFIFSREKTGEIDIATPGANGALRGTQLYVRTDADGGSRFQVLEGQVELSNPHGKLMLRAGEAGEAFPGRAPRRTAVIEAKNLLQWALYYPAVLDPEEMAGLADGALGESVRAYQAGSPLKALEKLGDRAAGGQGGALYRAAVVLAVGEVDEAEDLLGRVPAGVPGRKAVERMIAAVKHVEREPWPDERLTTASEAMAESYYRQSRPDLQGALDAARIATRISPRNGYAWTRVAELEFSFGRSKEARQALATGLELTPENARAHALNGFVLSAENDMKGAAESFARAIELDGALGNGWLGQGLVKIKRGDLAGGTADLHVAATVEPTISAFHSYLGKAFGMERREDDARKDLDLAVHLDPNDPTPLLYSALELQAGNRTNAAIADLERSIDLNDNRRVYRSSLLLDQDRAVRSANLARIYQNAGMREVAVREATRAVESDYTNPSAHLFLANSFDALRDPKRIALRHETPWFNELLLSNLLAPVGGGALSQFVSQQEYSKLLEEDGLGGSLATELRSTGESRTAASLFGTSGNVSFGIDAYLRDDSGNRFNSDATLQELYAQFKWQVTPDDIFYFLGKWAEQESGDNFDTYDNRPLSPLLDFEENQEPGLLLAGWNHRWAPGSHTLVLAGRLSAEQRLTDPDSTQLLIQRDPAGLRPGFIQEGPGGFDAFTDPGLAGSVEVGADGETLVYSKELLAAIAPWLGRGDVLGTGTASFAFETLRRFDVNSLEIQQIHQSERNLLLAGMRLQDGEFETTSLLELERPTFSGGFATPASSQHEVVDFKRTTLYAYDYWSVIPELTLIGGVSWDKIEHPDNFRNPPLNALSKEDEEWSAKAGFTWTPSRRFAARGLFAQGMGGVSFDESVRLEPVQVAGFNQAYRTVISESIAGSVEVPRYTLGGLSFEGSFPTRTWWGVAAGYIGQEVDRTIGAFTGYDSTVFPIAPAYFADDTPQRLDYDEASLELTLNQLLGEEFSIGATTRATRSELRTTFPELVAFPGFDLKDEATLYELLLFGCWNSPTGLFARAEANFFRQDLEDDPRGGNPPRDGDDFWHFNAFLGYRFNRNLSEVALGVLNLGDQDYRLSPLSPRGELERGRTAVLRCRFSF